MKKAISFIFSLLMIFSPFLDQVHAGYSEQQIYSFWLTNAEAKINLPSTPSICRHLLTKMFGTPPKQEVQHSIANPSKKEKLNDGGKSWAKEGAQFAKENRLPCKIYQIMFNNSEPYWVIIVNKNGTLLVCDYYKILYELSQKGLPFPENPWPLISLSEYMKIKVMDEGKSLYLIWSPDDPMYQTL